MNGIKLPVTVSLVNDGDESFFVFLDADDNEIGATEGGMRRIAAALNAAPKRAFAELTAEVLGEMRSEAIWAVESKGVQPSETRSVLEDAELLARLQAFAAPQAPQWQPLGEEGASGQVFFGHSKLDGLSIWVLEAAQDGENWYECVYSEAGHSEDLPTVTHWMPLPAAPEAQGRADHG